MKLFISDLHLGNILFDKKKVLFNLLTSEKYDQVFILGDVLDTWSMELEHIILMYGNIISAINSLGSKCIIIKGNHDPDFDVLSSIFNKVNVIKGTYTMVLNRRKTILMHGDEFDSSGALLSFCFRCLAPIQWMFTKAGMAFSYRLRDWYYKQKHGSNFYHKVIIGTERDTIEKYSPENSVIIMGHTHMAKIVQNSDCTYINCGTALDNASAIEFDGENFNMVRY